jgi:hypothetical protein
VFVQIAQRPVAKAIPPALPAMFGCVVQHVAPLTQCREVRRRVVAGIVIQMCAGQHDPRHPHLRQRDAQRRDPAALRRSPASPFAVPPAPVAQMRHPLQMRTATALAATARAVEPDRRGQLRPVDRIEPAVFGTDRHDDSMSRPNRKGKRKAWRATASYSRSKSISPNRSSVASAGGRGYFSPVAQLNKTTSSSASTSPSRSACR